MNNSSREIAAEDEPVELLCERVGWSVKQSEEWVDKINTDPSSLSRDELFKPMIETGGKVSLLVEWEGSDGEWYYTIEHRTEIDVLLHYHEGSVEVAHDEAESRLRQDATHKFGNIKPVPREETPFEEDS